MECLNMFAVQLHTVSEFLYSNKNLPPTGILHIFIFILYSYLTGEPESTHNTKHTTLHWNLINMEKNMKHQN